MCKIEANCRIEEEIEKVNSRKKLVISKKKVNKKTLKDRLLIFRDRSILKSKI